MRTAKIKIESVEEFVKRGRKIAKLADAGKPIPYSRIISFEDPEDFLAVLTPERMRLLQAARESPGSITDLARTLKRDRSAVTRDVQVLKRHGIVDVTERPLAGHGRRKWVAPVARVIELTARI